MINCFIVGSSRFLSLRGSVCAGVHSSTLDTIHPLTPRDNLDSPTNWGNWIKSTQTLGEHADSTWKTFQDTTQNLLLPAIITSLPPVRLVCSIFTSFVWCRLWLVSYRWAACHNFGFWRTPFKHLSSTRLSCSQGRPPIGKAIKCRSCCDLRAALNDFSLNENKLTGCHYAIYSPP